MHRARVFTSVLASLWVVLFVVACQEQSTSPVDVATPGGLTPAASDATEEAVLAFMDGVNAQLVERGDDVRLGVVEYITSDDGEQVGRTVFFRHLGNKQLGHHWVPADPRRHGGTDIMWLNDLVDGATTSGLNAGQTATAIRNSMTTWQNARCSTIPLTDLGDFAFDFGFVQWLQGFGGVGGFVFDITHGGFLPGAFWDTIAPGGSGFILGATFTFIWVQGPNPTDIDNNGKLDTAFREIYYNDAFPWFTDGSTFDVETVALHEVGHGLSQAHFGTAFRDAGGQKLHFSPRALMNAAYSGVQRTVRATDNGGHCSIWGQWPNS
jgi:hypothetical protein